MVNTEPAREPEEGIQGEDDGEDAYGRFGGGRRRRKEGRRKFC